MVTIRRKSGEIVYDGDAEARHFSTGSWGWMAAGKADLPGSTDRRLQVNVQLVVIGSKPNSDKAPK